MIKAVVICAYLALAVANQDYNPYDSYQPSGGSGYGGGYEAPSGGYGSKPSGGYGYEAPSGGYGYEKPSTGYGGYDGGYGGGYTPAKPSHPKPPTHPTDGGYPSGGGGGYGGGYTGGYSGNYKEDVSYHVAGGHPFSAHSASGGKYGKEWDGEEGSESDTEGVYHEKKGVTKFLRVKFDYAAIRPADTYKGEPAHHMCVDGIAYDEHGEVYADAVFCYDNPEEVDICVDTDYKSSSAYRGEYDKKPYYTNGQHTGYSGNYYDKYGQFYMNDEDAYGGGGSYGGYGEGYGDPDDIDSGVVHIYYMFNTYGEGKFAFSQWATLQDLFPESANKDYSQILGGAMPSKAHFNFDEGYGDGKYKHARGYGQAVGFFSQFKHYQEYLSAETFVVITYILGKPAEYYCKDQCGEKISYGDYSCYCDHACVKYGDCCADACESCEICYPTDAYDDEVFETRPEEPETRLRFTGLLAGGSLGLSALAIFGCYKLRKRRRKSQYDRVQSLDDPSPPDAQSNDTDTYQEQA